MMKLLFNPFERYSEKQLVFVGIISTIVGSLMSIFFNSRFDGILDLHFVEKIKIHEPIIDLLIDLFCLVLILFLIGRYINIKTRIIDIISATLISKIPFYFLLFQNIDGILFRITDKLTKSLLTKNYSLETITTIEMAYLVFSGIIGLALIIWSITLLFNGFKTATNAKNTKSILLFIVAVILSEVVSKILISKFN
jgi:hypothetical protein